MADKYSAVITNAGASYLLKSNLSSNGKFKISKIEVCDHQIADLIDAMGWNYMTDGNCNPVTTIEGEDEVNKVLRKVMIDDYVAQLRITLGPEVGDSTNPTLPLSYGSIGVYLYNYDDDGEVIYGQDILFMIGSLDTIFNKYMNSNLTAGNTVSFYLQAAVSNRPSINEITIKPTEYYSIPSVPSEDDSKEKLTTYYNTYIVDDYDTSDTPAIVVRNNDGKDWIPFHSSNELAPRLIPGGGIYEIMASSNEAKLPTYQVGASGFIVSLPPKSTLAFPCGFSKDSTFKTTKVYQEFGLKTNEISGDDTWTVLATYTNGTCTLISVKSDGISRHPDQPENDGYWYDRSKNISYKIEGGILNEVSFVEIATLKIENGQVTAFRPANVISSISQSDYNYVNTRMDDIEAESSRIDNSVVHITGDEKVDGQKTFLRDVILQSTSGGESTTDLILKSGVDLSTNGTIQFNTSKNVEKGRFTFGIDNSGNTSVEISARSSSASKSYLKINTGASSENLVVDASSDVKYAIAQNLVGYNHKNSDGTSKQINIEGKWSFSQDITGQMFYGTAYRSLWGDLAEIYQGDEDFIPGTLVDFGGEYELTAASENVCGVISCKPGFVLNGQENKSIGGFPVLLALSGKVPVRVIGKVRKFDRLTLSDKKGVAKVAGSNDIVIGVALCANESDDEKLVMCSTRFRIN